MSSVETAPEFEALWRDSSARLRAWFERETGGAADADDLLQETFARVHERLDTLVDAASVRAWVGRIARNVLLDHLRASARRTRAVSTLEAEPDELPSTPAESSSNLDLTVAGWLEDFLARLAPEDAAALRLVDLEGRSQAELAARAGLSLSGAKSRVHRARTRLRAQLEACCAFAFDARGGILAARRRGAGPCADTDCPETCEE